MKESDTDFMIRQSNHGVQTESDFNAADKGFSLDNTYNPTGVNYPQVDMHTLEEHIVSQVRSEVDCVMTTVETRVQDAVLTAIESLVILRIELAMKSANASSEPNLDGSVSEPDQRDFSGNIEGLQMTASSRINSYAYLNKIDETGGNSAVEVVELVVNEKNIDRQRQTHHSNPDHIMRHYFDFFTIIFY